LRKTSFYLSVLIVTWWRETTKGTAVRVQEVPEEFQQATVLLKAVRGEAFGKLCGITWRGGRATG
jgi:hypothetical protein